MHELAQGRQAGKVHFLLCLLSFGIFVPSQCFSQGRENSFVPLTFLSHLEPVISWGSQPRKGFRRDKRKNSQGNRWYQ